MTAPPFDAIQKVRLGDIDVAYVDTGIGIGAGTDPPIVLVHGFACGMRMWGPQIRLWGGRGRMIAYDQRGHGLTDAPDDAAAYSGGHLNRDLLALLDHLGLDRVTLVGFSMGGGPALALALSAPKRVGRLVLADVGSGAENPWALVRLAEVWADLARREGRDALIADMLRSEFFKVLARRGPAAHRYMKTLLRQHQVHGIVHTLQQVLARRKPMFRLKGKLAALAVPTLVIAGARDFACHKAERLMLSTIPRARGVRIAQASHMAPVEKPALFARALADFLVN